MAISQLEIAMNLIHSMHPLARAWLLDGPLSSFIEAFQALLERGQYAEGSSGKVLRALSHFSYWMTKCQSRHEGEGSGQASGSQRDPTSVPGRRRAVEVPQDLVITRSSEARPSSSYESIDVAFLGQLCITACCA